MSVLCSRIPDFALTLAARRSPTLVHRPVALLDPGQTVCARSAPARQAGVQVGMTARQAHMRCPDLTLLPADLAETQHAQDAFLAELAQWELPVEAHGLGMAYVDLHTVTTARADVQGLAADLGRRLRGLLGDDLQPALGWDHSKFCARAAAYRTAAGRIKLVDQADEVPFLAPLPVTLLPLPPYDLQRLHWLGIVTLGQFAALPAGAVRQQFGKAGQLAQRWAQGRDDRPVRNMLDAAWSPQAVDFETPTDRLPPVVAALMAQLQPHLDAWAAALQGCTRLRLHLEFLNRDRHALDLLWLEPVSQPARLRLHLENQLAAFPWPAPLARIVVAQAVTAELPTLQLSLFTEPVVEQVSLGDLAASLKHRYGPIFLRGRVTDDTHPADERRIHLATL